MEQLYVLPFEHAQAVIKRRNTYCLNRLIRYPSDKYLVYSCMCGSFPSYMDDNIYSVAMTCNYES